MKIFIFLVFFTNFLVVEAQNLFNDGLDHFNKGEYHIADSLFNKYLKESPNDINAHYNRGVTRLNLGDTCVFCQEMSLLRNWVKDKSANDLYTDFCGGVDTLYYDKEYIICKKGNERYTVIFEKFKCLDYELVSVHDKRTKGKTTIVNPFDLMNPEKTDIIAVYQLYPDNHKVFTFSLTPPHFPGGDKAQSDFKDSSPLIQQTKTAFNLHKVVADVEYIIDKNGDIKEFKVTRVNKEIEQLENFKKAVNLYILSMPKQTPAKFQGEKVDYLVTAAISYW